MRKILVLGIVIFAILFLLLFGYNLASQNALARSVRDSLAAVKATARQASFQVMAILPSRDDTAYYSAIRESLLAAASEADIALRLLEYRLGAQNLTSPADPLSLPLLVESCSMLDIQGLIIAIPDSPELKKAIDVCVEAGIPVLTLEYDSPLSRRMSFIGSNPFQAGYSAGLLAARVRPTKARVVCVLPALDADSPTGRESLRMGLLSALDSYGDMRVLEVLSPSQSFQEGEGLLRELRERHPLLNVLILCTQSDTMALAQALIDLNLVGEINLIGVANSIESKRYVERGVVQAAIFRDPVLAGKACITSIRDIISGKAASAYVDTGIKTLLPAGSEIGQK